MMKFKYKDQDYQNQAVKSVVNLFQGQVKINELRYDRYFDLEKGAEHRYIEDEYIDTSIGFRNEKLHISNEELLQNLNDIQSKNDIKNSSEIIKVAGVPSFDIEMETGTGKTYVYIKTIYELNQKYGWSKFIIIVPSVAIREGVNKTFEDTENHFMEKYGKKIRYFIYDSNNLNEIDNFSSSSDINVMIINMQAFNSSFDEDRVERKSGGKEARKIYGKSDYFASRRPIDVIAENNPILILDEPQKMGGEKTQKALKNFNPLFVLNYSATHKEKHNLVYVLDALDAYNKKLVKKIEVKGFEVKNLAGTNSYLYLEDILISDETPKVRIEFERNTASREIKKYRKILKYKDNLYNESNFLKQYKNFIISDINGNLNYVEFTNGLRIYKGEVYGDIVDKDIRRVQIRETIDSHFEKEEKLFYRGIKTLSLFFIDEVAKYREYDKDGSELLGEYGKIFEEEYINKLSEIIRLDETPYIKYLKQFDVEKIHNGYFSIDNKGRVINSKIKRGQDSSDDISAYDLILKDKARLLSFAEPTRFIFSHSALREGWDNPNIFQICTLKQSESNITKRQEVGRGLRLAINQDGVRQDKDILDNQIHDINLLTVIASESYKTFVNDLQTDIKKNLYERPTKISKEYYLGKKIIIDNQEYIIKEDEPEYIDFYMKQNSYVDYKGKLTNEYKEDLKNGTLKPFAEEFKHLEKAVHLLNQAIYDDSVLEEMIDDGNSTKIYENPLNDNIHKKEFKILWNKINHKYAFKVEFSDEELIEKSIETINKELKVNRYRYSMTMGSLSDKISFEDAEKKAMFIETNKKTKELNVSNISNVKYDLIGEIAGNTKLTRKTVGLILSSIELKKFLLFKENPEQFINNISKIINEQKASMIIEYVSYNKLDDKFEMEIFTKETTTRKLSEAYKAKKSIQDYVFTDGYAVNSKSVERKFAEDLDNSEEVVVYAKLPRGFKIPTPVGNYSPDWAISFKEGLVNHMFFIAETKGTLESLSLRPIEKAKIKCAEKLFNEISTENVRYSAVDSFESLMDIVIG